MLHTAEVGKHGVVVTTLERATPTRQAYQLLRAAVVLVVMGLGLDAFMMFLSSPSLLAPGLTAKVSLAPPMLLMITGGIHIGLAALAGARPRVGGYLLALWLVAFAVNLVLAHHLLFAVICVQAAVAAIAIARMETAYDRVTELD